MIILRNYILQVALCVGLVQICDGQKNPAYVRIQSYTKQPKQLEKLGMNHYQAEWCTYMGYSDTKAEALALVGVDLVKAISSPELRNNKDKAALADCIVIGNVVRIEHDSSEVPYHTIAYLKVDKFLRNDFNVNEKEIPILIKSGPAKGGLRLEVQGEKKLDKNERVLLFLSATSLIFNSYYKSPAYYKKIIDQRNISFLISYKYLIDGVRVTDNGKTFELNKMMSEIEYVTRALTRSPFHAN